MAYSLGLTLYNLANRREAGQSKPRPARPPGRLVWLHAPNAEAAPSLAGLGRQLVEDDGLGVLITCDTPLVLSEGVIQDEAPKDSAAACTAFLDHWKPELCILADGELRPALLLATEEKSIPVMMVQAREPYLLRERDGWYPGLIRSLLQRITHVMALDEPSARAFRKAGADSSVVEVSGRMEEKSDVLPYNEAERAAIAETLAARPVWLAAGLCAQEEDTIIAAHRYGLRLAHRLLLIIAAADPHQAERLAERIEQQQGWQVALRASDQEPLPEIEVLIADSPSELGLWYRLAPITFLGGSLAGNGCLRDPMEAAALGSALICGPRPGVHGNAVARLSAARAMREVGSAGELADALSELLAPDRAARLAQSAWTVASDGAEVTEKVILRIRHLIDGDS